MVLLRVLGLLLALWHMGCLALPVDFGTTTEAPAPSKNRTKEDWNTGLEYDRYLKEIVNVLEDDEVFRKKMEAANPEQFKTGEIAKELNFLSHNVRSKLDEIKRQELTRLRSLVREQMERTDVKDHKAPGAAHLNAAKEEFDEEDLKRLIQQTTSDLEAADKDRQKEFKEYELEKEHKRREKLKSMDERNRHEAEKQYKDEQEKHKQHPNLHHPGSKAQLEEVWEETDGLPKEDFNPKTFFLLHDLNQDGVLDQGELEALFQKELDKMYDPSRPEDDMQERNEEMARMREHVMREIDKNKDGMVSFEEFMNESQKQSFDADPGWETLDQQPLYNENELQDYERQLAMHQQQVAQGGYGPPGGGYQGQGPPGGYNPNYQQGGYNQNTGGHQQQQGNTGYNQQNQQHNQQQQGNYQQQQYNNNNNFQGNQGHQQGDQMNNGTAAHSNNDPNSLNSVNIAGGRH